MLEKTHDHLLSLISELTNLPNETEWVEFKENKAEPKEIGEYISALSNSAALTEKPSAYLVWGVRDGDHKIIGTNFRPESAKVGSEELESWLLRQLNPKIDFKFYSFRADGSHVVLLEISSAFRHPVQFEGVEYIRIGSYKKKLKDYAEKERALWRFFDRIPFERTPAADNVSDSGVLKLLNTASYFQLLRLDQPVNKNLVLESLQADALISSTASGKWDVTNLGAILFASNLNDFAALRRKIPRIILYQGTSRTETIRERQFQEGYAVSFESVFALIQGTIPSNEVIRMALREEAFAYPNLVIRELLANALIHQDFFVTGSGPTVEIFDDRVEFTNPGIPLVKAERFIDTPPRSRNEALASLMRRLGMCEERGSGWDKIAFKVEYHQLPAPLIEVTESHTRIVLFAHRNLSRMDREERDRALYLHSCLRYVTREHMTNASVRERFGIPAYNSATASRLIRDAVATGLIVPYDTFAAPKLMRYVPHWAAPNPVQNT